MCVLFERKAREGNFTEVIMEQRTAAGLLHSEVRPVEVREVRTHSSSFTPQQYSVPAFFKWPQHVTRVPKTAV